MSAQVKKAGRIGTKIVAVFLFLFLVMVNVEVGLYDGEGSGNGILGLTMSMFVPGAFAGGGSNPGDCDGNCGIFSCLAWASCGGTANCGGPGDPGADCKIDCLNGGYIQCVNP